MVLKKKTNGVQSLTSLPSSSKNMEFSSGASTDSSQQNTSTVLTKRKKKKLVTYTQAALDAISHIKSFMTDPQKALVMLKEARHLLEIGDARSAMLCCSEGISYTPTISLFSLRAACYKSLEQYTEAYFDYSYCIRLEPENGNNYCSRGICLAKMRKLEMALEDLSIAIEYEPSALHYYTRGCVYAEFWKFEEAIQDFTSTLNLTDSTCTPELKLKAKYRRALSYFDHEDLPEAAEDCASALLIDPNAVPPRALLARIYKLQYEFKKAEEQITIAIMIDENQPALLSERGDIRLRTGDKNKVIEAIYDFDKAIKILDARRNLIVNDPKFQAAEPNSLSQSSTSQLGSPTFHNSVSSSTNSSANVLSKNLFYNLFSKNESAVALGMGTGVGLNEIEEMLGENYYKMAQGKLLIENSYHQKGLNYSNFMRVKKKKNGDNEEEDEEENIEVEENLNILPPISPTNPDFPPAFPLSPSNAKTVMIDLEGALSDALMALRYSPNEIEYQLVLSSCYIRLQRYDEAIRELEKILISDPENKKASYNLAFCRRANGQQKNAIDELTKIIDFNFKIVEEKSVDTLSTIPMHRIYEMRGTLFHEANAHKLSLIDLGKAIAINPDFSGNYFIRADCHYRLGNYEQALRDYNMAEEKNFGDIVALRMSRGMIKRLLYDFQGSIEDYKEAYKHLRRDDKVNRIRTLSFMAFIYIDLHEFQLSRALLFRASQINFEFITSLYSSNPSELFITSPSPTSTSSSVYYEVLYAYRTHWILQYHLGLCYYMLNNYKMTIKILTLCFNIEEMHYDSIDNHIKLFIESTRNNTIRNQLERKKVDNAEKRKEIEKEKSIPVSPPTLILLDMKEKDQMILNQLLESHGFVEKEVELKIENAQNKSSRPSSSTSSIPTSPFSPYRPDNVSTSSLNNSPDASSSFISTSAYLIDVNHSLPQDDIAIGTLQFFISLSLIKLKKFSLALSYLTDLISNAHWRKYYSENNFLLLFCLGKVHQNLSQYEESIKYFNEVIELIESNSTDSELNQQKISNESLLDKNEIKKKIQNFSNSTLFPSIFENNFLTINIEKSVKNNNLLSPSHNPNHTTTTIRNNYNIQNKIKNNRNNENYLLNIFADIKILLPYCYFRRGWCHKSLKMYSEAGNDFEQAKYLAPNDPNFTIDYRTIDLVEFIEINNEPDTVVAFPPLLPLPGLE